MKLADNIEKLIRNLRVLDVNANAEMDQRILGDALKVQEEIKKTKMALRWLFVLSIIMKSRITKFAAVVIIVAALIGIHQFGEPIDGASVAFADVREAFLAQSWVHLRYDNGREMWISLKDRRCFAYIDEQNRFRIIPDDMEEEERNRFEYQEMGRIVFDDLALGLRQVYWPLHGNYITETKYEGKSLMTLQTAWEIFVGPLKKGTKNGSTGIWGAKQEIVQVDEGQLVRFDTFYLDALDRKLLIKQVWADPETRLPVKIRERLQLAEREAQDIEFITGKFEFPESGPTSIYDLGVSHDIPIIKDRPENPAPAPEIVEVLESVKKARERFPEQYLSITWDNNRTSYLQVKYQDGQRIWLAQYQSSIEPYHLPIPATASEVSEWTQTQVPNHVTMVDGKNRYRRTNPSLFIPTDSGSRSKVRVLGIRRKEKDSAGYFGVESWPEDHQWPLGLGHPASRFELIKDIPVELSHCIGLRFRYGADIRRDCYIDPEHDYICVKWIWWKPIDGGWKKHREYNLSDFVQLPEGQWYASSEVLTTFADPEKGYDPGGVSWTIDVKVLEEEEFPPDLFNGEKLLEDAEVETY